MNDHRSKLDKSWSSIMLVRVKIPQYYFSSMEKVKKKK